MGTSISLNSVSYTIPALAEDNWGTSVSNYLIALSTGVLSKGGGTFTLTADVDFGASFGLKSIYYKSRGTVASAGIVRLANNESVGWRNAANGADKLLKLNASDILEFDGNPIPTIALGAADTVLQMNGAGTAFEFAKLNNANVDAAAAIDYSKLAALTSANILVGSAGNVATVTAVTGDIAITNGGVTSISSGVIVNDDVNAAAAIAYSKLNLATSIVNADVSASAAIAYSKLNLATSIVNADVSASAAIAYSKLNLGTSIVNADISGSAAIAYSKLNLGTSIVNADVSASAAIAYSKLNLTNSIVSADITETTGSGDVVLELSPTITTPTITSPVFNTAVSGTAVLDEDNMASDSATKLATQQSIKAYVDTSITAVTGAADSVDDRWNYSISATVGSSALTVALKTKAAADPSAGSPVKLGFRNATLATGDYAIVSATAATSVVVPSTATMGWTSGDTRYVYVYAINNAGTIELGVSSQLFDENALATSTTVDTGADSATVLYSTTGRASKAIRYLGKVLMTQATAGTWATSPAEISIGYKPKAATAMDDSEATRMGLKPYFFDVSGGGNDIAYNNGLKGTASLAAGGGSLTAISYGVLFPYQVQNGQWRMKFNVRAAVSSAARTTLGIAINGVTFAAGIDQAIAGSTNSAAASIGNAYAGDGSGNLVVSFVSTTIVEGKYSGDVALSSKPTWAYG